MPPRKAIDPTLPLKVQTAESVWCPGDAVRIEWTADASDDSLGRTVDWLFWTVAACDGAWLRLVARSAPGATHAYPGTYTLVVPLAWVACAEIGADDLDLDDADDDGTVPLSGAALADVYSAERALLPGAQR